MPVPPPAVPPTLRLRAGNLLAALACLVLAGCVSSKYDVAAAIGAEPTAIDVPLGGAPLAATINSVIIFQGPGTWKKKAYWDELIVTVVNGSDRPVILTGCSLVDRFGHVLAAGDDPWRTEEQGLAQQKHYQRQGTIFVLNALGYAAYTYGAVGVGVVAGALTTASWGGVVAGATVGLAAVPVTAIVVYARNQEKRRIIENEFHRRRWPLPVTLGPGEARRASLFFPMSVSPRELVLAWSRDGAAGDTRLPTPGLAGLHESHAPAPPPPAPPAAPVSAGSG